MGINTSRVFPSRVHSPSAAFKFQFRGSSLRGRGGEEIKGIIFKDISNLSSCSGRAGLGPRLGRGQALPTRLGLGFFPLLSGFFPPDNQLNTLFNRDLVPRSRLSGREQGGVGAGGAQIAGVKGELPQGRGARPCPGSSRARFIQFTQKFHFWIIRMD